MVNKRTFPGTSASRSFSSSPVAELAAPTQVRLQNAAAMLCGQGRREGGVSAASWQQGRDQEIALPRRISQRHGGFARSVNFGVAPSAALCNLASNSETRSAIRFRQALFLKVATESQSSPPAEIGSGKGAGRKALNALAPTHPRLRSSPREEICSGKGHVK